jgi:hypothetical protein
MQNEMMDQFAKAVESLPSPDTSHTWAQAPIRFEDALGRVIPIPSEYDWDVRLITLPLRVIELILLDARGSAWSALQKRSAWV